MALSFGVAKSPLMVSHVFAGVPPDIFCHFHRFRGSDVQNACPFVGRTQTRHFRRFRQNPPVLDWQVKREVLGVSMECKWPMPSGSSDESPVASPLTPCQASNRTIV